MFADYASSVGSLVDQVDFVVEVEGSVAVAVEAAVVPVPAPVLAAAVDGEDMVLAAALKVVVPQVIVVFVFVPEERHRSVVAFRADSVIDNGTSMKVIEPW